MHPLRVHFWVYTSIYVYTKSHTVTRKIQIPYTLVGAHAVALHGTVRGTVDIDFIIKWSLKNLTLIEKALNELGLTSRLPIRSEDM